jgi:hypothetical protein
MPVAILVPDGTGAELRLPLLPPLPALLPPSLLLLKLK